MENDDAHLAHIHDCHIQEVLMFRADVYLKSVSLVRNEYLRGYAHQHLEIL